MPIPLDSYSFISDLDIDEHRTLIAYSYWEEQFPSGSFLHTHVARVKSGLGEGCTRSELVSFYKEHDVPPETKFLAAMIWGHEAPAGSRRDHRGPWKLSKMFADAQLSTDVIRSVSVATDQDIISSYKRLNKVLDRCGPNFFTKHFYFLGKATYGDSYPLIFDDRVATGFVKLRCTDGIILDSVRVSADRTPAAYLSYLKFAREWSQKIGCDLDKIEYFLFTR